MTQMTQKIGKTLLRTYACTYAQHFYCINPSNVSFRQTDSGTVTVGTVEIPKVHAYVRTYAQQIPIKLLLLLFLLFQ